MARAIDFRQSSGQNSLLFYTRWSAELDLGLRHTLVFLYQPLESEGVRTPVADERYEGVTFAAGAPVRTTFGFPFYRFSYLLRGRSGGGRLPRAGWHGADPQCGLPIRAPRRLRLLAQLERGLRPCPQGARGAGIGAVRVPRLRSRRHLRAHQRASTAPTTRLWGAIVDAAVARGRACPGSV